ncbi:MAG: NAD(P)H-dependent oxidoreductase [Gemmatimonadetes bacterium]|nr:NAD(P)H-dependent oxidoreductase [Gemmatimonadota bacterium]
MIDRTISIAIVQGSVRPGNFTAKAVAVVADELRQQSQVSVDVIDPATLDLPLPGAASENSGAEQLQERIQNAIGVILATPEYHGGYSSVIKLAIENMGFPSVLKGKPVALLGVAAGQIGAIKALEQLRSVVSHVGAIVLPGPVSIAGVQGKFDEGGNVIDAQTDGAIRSVGTNLVHYIHDNLCPKMALEEMVRAEAA